MTRDERATIFADKATQGIYYLKDDYQGLLKMAYLAGDADRHSIDIEKACEWLERNQAHIISETGIWLMWTAFLDDFRKAMEE